MRTSDVSLVEASLSLNQSVGVKNFKKNCSRALSDQVDSRFAPTLMANIRQDTVICIWIVELGIEVIFILLKSKVDFGLAIKC